MLDGWVSSPERNIQRSVGDRDVDRLDSADRVIRVQEDGVSTDRCVYPQRSPAARATVQHHPRARRLALHGEWRRPGVNRRCLCNYGRGQGHEAAKQRKRAEGAGHDHQDNRRTAEQER